MSTVRRRGAATRARREAAQRPYTEEFHYSYRWNPDREESVRQGVVPTVATFRAFAAACRRLCRAVRFPAICTLHELTPHGTSEGYLEITHPWLVDPIRLRRRPRPVDEALWNELRATQGAVRERLEALTTQSQTTAPGPARDRLMQRIVAESAQHRDVLRADFTRIVEHVAVRGSSSRSSSSTRRRVGTALWRHTDESAARIVKMLLYVYDRWFPGHGVQYALSARKHQQFLRKVEQDTRRYHSSVQLDTFLSES